ncbi:cytochrome d ubiquinol oxidase subunit II [Thermococcus sp.]|uniref:cytochrome d ubiquinol oxidase subunit II n=1 Tax=Thermococcus sp. TaxID=35749 RepID=UPI00261E23D2|nr:cytochrome d ubiquinol oxidase subunit II [Thermococcus sp.]
MDYATAWFYFSAFLLGMYLAFDGFDLGIGTLLAFIKNQKDRDVLINTIAPVWDGNEVWFITWGAGIFAMWPALYATLFSTFYLAIWLLAFLFIFRAVGFEFRNKNKELWDKLFALVSALIPLVIGVVVGNLVMGIPIDAKGFHGSLLTLFRPYPLIVGLFVLFAVLWHGANWGVYKTTGKLQEELRGYAFKFWLLTVVFLLLTVIGMKIWAPPRFERLMTPLGLGLTLIILIAGLLDGYLIKKGAEKLAFYISWLAFPLVVFLIYYTMYPYWIISTIDPNFRLSIQQLAASPLTLQAVLGISVILAVIIMVYTLYVYKMFGGKVTEAEGYY